MNVKDITSQVKFDNPDDELLPFRQCVCGQEWDSWDKVMRIYQDAPTICENCGRKFYFSQSVTVWEIIE